MGLPRPRDCLPRSDWPLIPCWYVLTSCFTTPFTSLFCIEVVRNNSTGKVVAVFSEVRGPVGDNHTSMILNLDFRAQIYKSKKEAILLSLCALKAAGSFPGL